MFIADLDDRVYIIIVLRYPRDLYLYVRKVQCRSQIACIAGDYVTLCPYPVTGCLKAFYEFDPPSCG